jgi:hypothetical protein
MGHDLACTNTTQQLTPQTKRYMIVLQRTHHGLCIASAAAAVALAGQVQQASTARARLHIVVQILMFDALTSSVVQASDKLPA